MIDIYIVGDIEVIVDTEAASQAMDYIVNSLTGEFKCPPEYRNDAKSKYFED